MSWTDAHSRTEWYSWPPVKMFGVGRPRALSTEPSVPPRIGSRLSEMGLPTPNIFTGGHEYHSVREWASVHDMAAAAATIVRLAEVWADR